MFYFRLFLCLCIIELFHVWVIKNNANETALRQAQCCKLLIKSVAFDSVAIQNLSKAGL